MAGSAEVLIAAQRIPGLADDIEHLEVGRAYMEIMKRLGMREPMRHEMLSAVAEEIIAEIYKKAGG